MKPKHDSWEIWQTNANACYSRITNAQWSIRLWQWVRKWYIRLQMRRFSCVIWNELPFWDFDTIHFQWRSFTIDGVVAIVNIFASCWEFFVIFIVNSFDGFLRCQWISLDSISVTWRRRSAWSFIVIVVFITISAPIAVIRPAIFKCVIRPIIRIFSPCDRLLSFVRIVIWTSATWLVPIIIIVIVTIIIAFIAMSVSIPCRSIGRWSSIAIPIARSVVIVIVSIQIHIFHFANDRRQLLRFVFAGVDIFVQFRDILHWFAQLFRCQFTLWHFITLCCLRHVFENTFCCCRFLCFQCIRIEWNSFFHRIAAFDLLLQTFVVDFPLLQHIVVHFLFRVRILFFTVQFRFIFRQFFIVDKIVEFNFRWKRFEFLLFGRELWLSCVQIDIVDFFETPSTWLWRLCFHIVVEFDAWR